MKRFTDNAGRDWQLAVTLGSVRRVRDALDIDLLSPESGDPPVMTRLATDEMLLGGVIAELLAPQLEARGTTPEQLADSFDGATMAAAAEAFFTELADFFQSRGRLDRATAIRKQTAVLGLAVTAATARIEAIDIETTLGALSGASPASSESTRAT